MKSKLTSLLMAAVAALALFPQLSPASPKDVQGTYANYLPKAVIPALRESLADSVTLTDAATTIAVEKDATLFVWSIAGNRTLDLQGHRAGRVFFISVKQDATGTRLVTWDTEISWPGNVAPTLTATASKIDRFMFVDNGTVYVGSTMGLNYTN